MSADTKIRRFSERTLKQVRLDGIRTLNRFHFDSDASEILTVECVDDTLETPGAFGRQLWFFEAVAVDTQSVRHTVLGAVVYSVEYGLQELVDDGVFDSDTERERFRGIYHHVEARPSWRHPAHRLLIAGLTFVTACMLAYLIVRELLN